MSVPPGFLFQWLNERNTGVSVLTGRAIAASHSTPPDEYVDVDVAIVAESTYPYLRGGVSAVVHDIVTGNPDLNFGIIHIAWDSASPSTDLYGMPSNVRWVKPVHLSMQEHRAEFMSARPADLRMSRTQRLMLAERLFDAFESVTAGDMDPFWELYDEGLNPKTRSYPLWALLGTKELMVTAGRRLRPLGLSLTDSFWLLREFFSLGYAIASAEFPKARVYHAHTTGYASLIGAAAARQHDTRFLLTEHNLYVRDTVNTLLRRNMALPITGDDWRTFDVTPVERAWMAWWIEMGRLCYPSAAAITYLYPDAIQEAAALGALPEKSTIIPNGMPIEEFDAAYEQRMRAVDEIEASGSTRMWRLAYIARIVPIKGLVHAIRAIHLLVTRGVTNLHLDVMGHANETPDYYESCRALVAELELDDYITFHGSVNVRERLADIDVLVLPSYNEGQPIVVLEAMSAGIPTIGTTVGGMEQLVTDPLITEDGQILDAAGALVVPATRNPEMDCAIADELQTLMADGAGYRRYAVNARVRVESFFRLERVANLYNTLYRDLGAGRPWPVSVEVPVQRGPGAVRPIQALRAARGRRLAVPKQPQAATGERPAVLAAD